MDYFLVLAIAIPFLFLIGVVYNAIKDQKKLENGKLKEILADRQRRGYVPPQYDDQDKYGLPARQDLRSYHNTEGEAGLEPKQGDVLRASTKSAGSTAVGSTVTQDVAKTAIQATDNLPSPKTTQDPDEESELLRVCERPLGPTDFEAKNASSYFSKYH